MWRCSASTMTWARRWGCTSAVGRRDRPVGSAAGRCGPTASGRWCWRTCRRSGGRSSWCSRRRWRCADSECSAGTVTELDREIAPPREKLTTRAGRWATRQAGRARAARARPVGDVAGGLGCSWHPVNESVRRWGGALLAADTQRIAVTEALGLDEHLMRRRGRCRTKAWATSIVDVGRGQLLDIVPGRTAKTAVRWLQRRPRSWLTGIRWGVPGPLGPVPGRIRHGAA